MPIRRATREDAAAGAAVLSAAQPDGLATAAGIAHRIAVAPPEARFGSWLEEDDEGAPRGWATCFLDWMSAVPGDAWCGVAVHPDHHGRGVGRALWLQVERHLREIGAVRVLAESQADAVSRGFAERRGFRVTAETHMLALDPRTLPEPEPLPADVEVRSFASFGDDLEELYEADYESAHDEPGEHDVSGMTFDVWRKATVLNPTFSAEGSTAALVDGVVAGTSLLYVDVLTGRALNGGTGVARRYRGRGLAVAMKRHGLAAAARAGVTRVLTQNDESNAPMLAVNARLGFRPFSTRLRLLRDAPLG